MCATVCPTQAIFYGTYEEWLAAGRAKQNAKPVNVFYFGQQRVQTRNYVVMIEQDEALDLLALAEQADLGESTVLPEATASRNTAPWVGAEMAGVPQREARPSPWEPRTPTTPEPEQVP